MNLKPIAIAAAILTGGGVAYFSRSAPVQANYQPPELIDPAAVVSKLMNRLTLTTWSCSGRCRAAEAGGANPRTCLLHAGVQSGTFSQVDDSCRTALQAACTATAVGTCSESGQ